MIQAAHDEIRRLERLQQGTQLMLMLLEGRTARSAAEENELLELRQRKSQLRERIAWFEAILREHDAVP